MREQKMAIQAAAAHDAFLSKVQQNKWKRLTISWVDWFENQHSRSRRVSNLSWRTSNPKYFPNETS